MGAKQQPVSRNFGRILQRRNVNLPKAGQERAGQASSIRRPRKEWRTWKAAPKNSPAQEKRDVVKVGNETGEASWSRWLASIVTFSRWFQHTHANGIINNTTTRVVPHAKRINMGHPSEEEGFDVIPDAAFGGEKHRRRRIKPFASRIIS